MSNMPDTIVDDADIILAYDPAENTWREITGELPAHTGMMCVMNHKGDSKFIWDSSNAVEVEAARNLFNDMKKKGMAAYSVVGNDATKGDVVHEFDPEAERLIFAPQLQGG